MTTTDYISEIEFNEYYKSKADVGAQPRQTAISAASRAVDAFCDRYFYLPSSTSSKFYVACASNPYWVDIDDLANTTSLVVKTDTTADGSYATTLTITTDFVLEPVNQQFGSITSYPYTAIRAKGLNILPLITTPWQDPTVKVTGYWGWATVPDPIKQATKIIAAQYVKLAEAPLGVAGWGAYGDIRVRDIPQAATLLQPYRRGSSFGIG